MITIAIIIAFALPQPPTYTLEELTALTNQWADLSIQDGLMEPEERGIRFAVYSSSILEQAIENFEFDCDTMIFRQKAMKADCPFVFERYKLPPQNQCFVTVQEMYRYYNWLKIQAPFATANELEVLTDELKQMKRKIKIWELMLDISNMNNFSFNGRRLDLQELRDLVGVENYNKCNWPSPLTERAYYYDW